MNTQQPSEPSPYALRAAKHRSFVRWLWGLYILTLGGIAALFFALSFQLPSFEQLENPRSRIASEVYSADGEILGKYYIENRSPVVYDSLPPHLVDGLIATEDERFYQHPGVDLRALARVAFRTVLLRQKGAGGGSTITQQLAKILIGRPDTRGMGTVARGFTLVKTKLTEWLTAIKLERSYTKEEIITLYFNEFDFISNAHGIKSAAEIYFAKTPSTLSLSESAVLVRMLNNPSLWNPRRNMKRAVEGRNIVLSRMLRNGTISKAEYEKVSKEPIDISRFRTRDHNDGLATHFREHLRDQLRSLLLREDMLKADGKPYDLYTDGLKIYTTIDSRMQAHAEQAVWNHLSEHQQKLFAHWPNWNAKLQKGDVSKDPWTYKVYKTTEDELRLRQAALQRAVSESDRYRIMRDDFMPTVVEQELRDVDLSRIFYLEQVQAKEKLPVPRGKKQETVEAILEKWKTTGYAPEKLIRKYEKILRSDVFTKIKKEHAKLMAEFDKPVPMTIFAYNKAGEKDTVMTPIDSIRYHRMHLQTGMMAVDPQTGYIRAWVGGLNHKYFKYDHVNKAANRQVGSSIKPFLYGLVISLRGYSPCYKVRDVETTIEPGEKRFGLIRTWRPKNASGSFSGSEMTLPQALRLSLNSISVQLMKDLGSTLPFRKFLREIGIDTTKVPESPTISLGAADLSVYEMAGGYSVFANNGIYAEPIFIERIEDNAGKVIYSATAEQVVEQVMSEEGAFVMSEILQTVQRGAPGFRDIKSKYGGKTGTTNFQADGWFMGITPNIVVGTWVGCDDRFIRFRTLAYGQGAKMARPIFQNFLRFVENDPDIDFDVTASYPEPEEISREMNCLRFQSFDSQADELMDYTNDRGYFDDYDDFDSPPKKKTPGANPSDNPLDE